MKCQICGGGCDLPNPECRAIRRRHLLIGETGRGMDTLLSDIVDEFRSLAWMDPQAYKEWVACKSEPCTSVLFRVVDGNIVCVECGATKSMEV